MADFDESLGKRRIGRVTYEGQYVIITVPDEWTPAMELPPPSPDDRWFASRMAFQAALNEAWDTRPINRRPWDAPATPAAPPLEGRLTR